jgi:filamentous hemagglutinin
VGTAKKLGESFTKPFTEGAQKLADGKTFDGTAQITEAASDTILNAATGGGKAVLAVVLKGGKLPKADVPDIDITFGQGITLQGKAFEDALEASGDFGQRLHPNSKTFDFFDPVSGNATSVKTLELLTDPRLRNPKQIYSTLTRYIDQAVDYKDSGRGIDIRAAQIKSKAIVIAVEGGGSKAQLAQIQRAVDYAKGRGLPIQIITVKGKGQ